MFMNNGMDTSVEGDRVINIEADDFYHVQLLLLLG